MKKIQRYKLLCIAFLLLSTNIVNASISLAFGTPIQSGSSLNIGVLISGLGENVAPSISTYDLNIIFDSNHLSYSSTLFGDTVLGNQLDLFDFGANFSGASLAEEGVLNIYEVSFDDTNDLNNSQADNFTLATLTFDILKSADSQLSFLVNDLGDAAENELVADLTTGSVSTVPVPAAFWFMASGLMVLYKKESKVLLT